MADNRMRMAGTRSNTSSPSPIHSSVANDALPRPVPAIHGLPADPANQLLPTTDPRIPTVGQHTFGNYQPYAPATQVPNWRNSNRSLAAEIASENRAAAERMGALRSDANTAATAELNAFARPDATAYRLRPVAPIYMPPSAPQAATVSQPIASTQLQQEGSMSPPSRVPASLAVLLERQAVPEAITSNVNVDRAPASTLFVARGRSSSLTESLAKLALAPSRPFPRPPAPTSNECRVIEDEPSPQRPTLPSASEEEEEASEKVEADLKDQNQNQNQNEAGAPPQSTTKVSSNDSSSGTGIGSYETADAGDSGCVADLLPLMPLLDSQRDGYWDDAHTMDGLVAIAQRISDRVASGALDKTLFADADQDGDTELLKALYSPHEYREECWLLMAGSSPAQLRHANLRGITPLMAAVAYGVDRCVVRALALLTTEEVVEEAKDEEGLEPSGRSQRHDPKLACETWTGNTALHWAAARGSWQAVDALLDPPTDAECDFVRAFRALGHVEGSGTCDRDSLRRAWSARAARAIDACNALGETPLFVACKRSNVEAAQRLLHFRADPRIQEFTEWRSPLHEAVLVQSVDLVNALVSQMSRPRLDETLDLETRTGETALDLARTVHPVTREQTETHDAIVALLENAAETSE